MVDFRGRLSMWLSGQVVTVSKQEWCFVTQWCYCLQIYPQGSGDLADLLACPPPQGSLGSLPLPLSTAQPQQLPLSGSMHTVAAPHSILNDPSAEPNLTPNPPLGPWSHAAELEGRVRGGFRRVSSHPELAAVAESAPILATPFAA